MMQFQVPYIPRQMEAPKVRPKATYSARRLVVGMAVEVEFAINAVRNEVADRSNKKSSILTSSLGNNEGCCTICKAIIRSRC